MSGSIFHPFVLDNAAGQETVVGIGSDSEKYGVGISSHTHITGIQTVDGFLHAGGGIKDTSGDMGSSGQILSSTGCGLNWINPGDANVTSASNVGTNLNTTNADQFVTFVGSSSGNNPIRVDAGLKYNPSTNVLTTGGNIMPDADDSQDLGGNDKRWRNIFTNDLQLSNKGKTNDVDGTWGDWTLQEGENKIFMINNRTGKKYSLKMEEE